MTAVVQAARLHELSWAASELDRQLGRWVDVETRQRIRFEKDRLITDASETEYRIDRRDGRAVLHTSQTRSLLAVSEDTLWLCHHMGNQALPKSVAGDPNDDQVVVWSIAGAICRGGS